MCSCRHMLSRSGMLLPTQCHKQHAFSHQYSFRLVAHIQDGVTCYLLTFSPNHLGSSSALYISTQHGVSWSDSHTGSHTAHASASCISIFQDQPRNVRLHWNMWHPQWNCTFRIYLTFSNFLSQWYVSTSKRSRDKSAHTYALKIPPTHKCYIVWWKLYVMCACVAPLYVLMLCTYTV